MSRRPSEEDLRSFLAGDLPEDQAVAIAELLDAQPLLATRLRQLDPLDAVLCSLDEPELPPELIGSILAQADATGPTVPLGAWIAGLSLIVLAAALAAIGSDPLGLVFDVADAAASAPSLLSALSPTLLSAAALLLATMLFVGASGVALSLSQREP